MVSTADRREVADLLVSEGCNVSSATAMVQMSRSAYRYKALPKDDSVLQGHLSELTAKHPAIGFWACHYRLRNKAKGTKELVLTTSAYTGYTRP